MTRTVSVTLVSFYHKPAVYTMQTRVLYMCRGSTLQLASHLPYEFESQSRATSPPQAVILGLTCSHVSKQADTTNSRSRGRTGVSFDVTSALSLLSAFPLLSGSYGNDRSHTCACIFPGEFRPLLRCSYKTLSLRTGIHFSGTRTERVQDYFFRRYILDFKK